MQMLDPSIAAARMYSNSSRFIEAYHAVLQPLCREAELPALALDILLFIANNPDKSTARDVCQFRGMKPGIVSFHVDRLAAAGLLGGTVQALSGAAGSRTIGLWLGAAAAPLLSVATVRLRRMRQGATHVRVRMTCGGRTAAFTAMVDSGNCLRDYLTHRPVIVMPQARGYRLFGLENTPLRPIFADTAGGRQMMLCLTPEATILDNGQTKRAVEALLALSPGLGGNAPALLPVSLLEDGQEGV